MEDYSTQRHRMVEEQIARRGLHDPLILAAFEAVPRHLFVPEEDRGFAYEDMALQIASRQTISQPYMVAIMSHLLGLKGTERVLEVGTGSGYQAAILSRLAGEVHTIEFIPELAGSAEALLRSLDLHNICFHTGDGSQGWPKAAPYEGIIVTAAAPSVPKPLLEQLADGGTLVIPVGVRHDQVLQVWKRRGNEFESRSVFEVAFVPLRGKYGYK